MKILRKYRVHSEQITVSTLGGEAKVYRYSHEVCAYNPKVAIGIAKQKEDFGNMLFWRARSLGRVDF